LPKGRLKTKQTSGESSLDSDSDFDITFTILKTCYERKTDRSFAPQVDIPIDRIFERRMDKVAFYSTQTNQTNFNLVTILGLTQCSVFIKKYR
jgi:hypothetical protein